VWLSAHIGVWDNQFSPPVNYDNFFQIFVAETGDEARELLQTFLDTFNNDASHPTLEYIVADQQISTKFMTLSKDKLQQVLQKMTNLSSPLPGDSLQEFINTPLEIIVDDSPREIE